MITLEMPTLAGADLYGVSTGQMRRALDEYSLEMAVIDGQAAQTIFAMREVLKIHEAGYICKRDALLMMVALDTTVELPEPFADIWRDSKREQALMLVDHIHKLVRLGAKNIAIMVDKSLYPEPRRPGLFERILRSLKGDP